MALTRDSDAGAGAPPAAHAIGGAEHTASTLALLNALISDATVDDVTATRTPSSHAVGGAEHSASTLAALNALVSDATLDDSSATRTPTAHTHPNADLTQVPGDGIDTSAIHDDTAGEILAVTLKAVPLGADVVLIEDTAAGNAKKRTTAQAIADLGGGGGLGYNVCFGADFSTAGFFARANGSGGEPEESSIGPRAELTIPKAGTFTALAYMTNSGSATTVIKIHVNSIVVETITLTGTDAVDTSVSTAVVAGDTVAIEYDASTNPGRSNFQLYIE